jgi:hypothetical protein
MLAPENVIPAEAGIQEGGRAGSGTSPPARPRTKLRTKDKEAKDKGPATQPNLGTLRACDSAFGNPRVPLAVIPAKAGIQEGGRVGMTRWIHVHEFF